MEYFMIMRSEVKANCYAGENCDMIEAEFETYCEGDKDSDTHTSDLIISLQNCSIGTRITVQEPMCPVCDMIPELCECGFDWKHWIEHEYS